jgi:hypothetical protein
VGGARVAAAGDTDRRSAMAHNTQEKESRERVVIEKERGGTLLDQRLELCCQGWMIIATANKEILQINFL